MSEPALFGQLSKDGVFTERQWVRIVKCMEEETQKRLRMRTFRPLGIRYIVRITYDKMTGSPEWALMPQEEGLRRRIQELADDRKFDPLPIIHIGDSQHKEEDIDPRNTRSAYGAALALQSCYLLNPHWYSEQGFWDWFDLTKDFAFAVLKVDNMIDLKEKLLRKEIEGIISGLEGLDI